jgi:hypothetical protein
MYEISAILPTFIYIIPFEPDVKEILALRRAMDEIMRETCIVFTPRTEEFNYVLIHRGFGGCLSRVGCNMAENEYGSQVFTIPFCHLIIVSFSLFRLDDEK